MAYGPGPRDERPGGGGLIAIGVLLLVQLGAELGILAYDLSQAGAGYLGTALGFEFSHYVQAPVGFFGYDTALSVALLALAIGAFNRGRWVRPAAVALLATNAYSSAAQLINQLTSAESRDSFADPVSHLFLNLTLVLAVLLAITVTAIVAATRTPSATPPAYIPPPGQYPGAYPYPPVPQAPTYPQTPPMPPAPPSA